MTATTEIRPGSRVVADGRPMQVLELRPTEAVCTWVVNGERQWKHYPLEQLQRFEPPLELVDAIARVTHEANRAFCVSLDDLSQPDWLHAPDWQKDSARAGVCAVLHGDVTEPWQSHESWMAQKIKDGWSYGPVKDPERKQHPCLVPFDELSESQRRKDHLFLAIVRALIKDI